MNFSRRIVRNSPVFVAQAQSESPILYNKKQIALIAPGLYECAGVTGNTWLEKRESLARHYRVIWNATPTWFLCSTKIELLYMPSNFIITRKGEFLIEGEKGDIIIAYFSGPFFIARKRSFQGSANASIYTFIPVCVNPDEVSFYDFVV